MAEAGVEARGASVVAAARRWIGTPYVHGASLCGAGADCLGLVRGLWRELVGPEPEPPPPYGPGWALEAPEERLLIGLARHLPRRAPAEAGPGDVALIRMRAGAPAGHLGVLAAAVGGRPTLIHAYSGRGVCESPLPPSWSRRIAAAFAFPERS